MGAEQPEEQRWKNKYRALLEEQAANDEHTDLLRQALIRLSYVAAGQTEALDELLQQLRHKIRRGGDDESLSKLIREIDDLAAELEPAPVSDAANDARPVSNNEPERRAEAVNTESANENRAREPAFTSISDRIESVLIDMVSKLKVPDTVAESKQRIEKTLQIGLNWYELIATLEELSLLVAGTLYEGEKDYASFLQQTIGSLANLQAMVEACQSMEAGANEHSRLLGEKVGESLVSLQAALQTDDIQAMKSAVQFGLNTIAENVQDFNEQQESNALELRENVHALTTQVLQLQQEVARAQQQVEQHKAQATTDPLTRLPNRKAYEERLLLEYTRWNRYQRPLSLAVVDIDFFKRVNDNYGHLLGDEVLKRVAAEIASSLRQTDFAARYGGEEFVLLLPETDEQNALIALEKLRTQIASLGFTTDDEPFTVTASFGLTSFRDEDNVNMPFARADQALYAAKQQGRNCCVIAEKKAS